MKRFFILFVLIFAHLTAFAQTSPSFDATLEAAQQSHAGAQFALGYIYYEGKAVRQDKNKPKNILGKPVTEVINMGVTITEF